MLFAGVQTPEKSSQMTCCGGQSTPRSIQASDLNGNQYVSMSDRNMESSPTSESKTSCWSTIEAETDRLSRIKDPDPCEKTRVENTSSFHKSA